jgi:anti-anti-sigma factor
MSAGSQNVPEKFILIFLDGRVNYIKGKATSAGNAGMDIGTRKVKDCQVIDVVGKINRLKDSIVLKSFINSILEKDITDLALNLAKVTYLDSGALNVLIFCHNTISKRGGTLCIIEPNEYVRDVLEVVGLDNLVKIYQNEEDFANDKESA